jgi:hypothetical protein
MLQSLQQWLGSLTLLIIMASAAINPEEILHAYM